MAGMKDHKQKMYEGRAFAIAKSAMEQVEWNSSQSQRTRKLEVPCRSEISESWNSTQKLGTVGGKLQNGCTTGWLLWRELFNLHASWKIFLSASINAYHIFPAILPFQVHMYKFHCHAVILKTHVTVATGEYIEK